MANWQDVEEAVALLPGTEPSTAYGQRAWRVRKKLLVWERPLRKADRDALGPGAPSGAIVGLPTEDADEANDLITAFPDVFFTTPHFDGYAAVLTRLDALPLGLLQHLVRAAWLRSAPKALVKGFVAEGR